MSALDLSTIENAQRWVVQAHKDENTCEHCKKNDRKTYRNRQEAYKDYPGGKGYIKCIGAQFGNKCRCIVRKRRKGGTKNVVDLNKLKNLAEKAQQLSKPGSSTAENKSWYRIENTLADTTEVYLYENIGAYGISANAFVMALNEIRTPKVHIRMNTQGGEVFDGVAIYNAIRRHPADFTTFIDSLAASAGSFIALAADRVVMAKTARMMIHNAQGAAYGDQHVMEEMRNILADLSENIAGIYAERAGGTVSEWLALMSKDTWFTAEDALTAGLVDEIEGEEQDEDDDEDTDTSSTPENSSTQEPVFTWDAADFMNCIKEALV